MKNRRNFKFAVMVALAVLTLTGCATSVGINALVPAEINMGNVKKIAVSSVTPYHFALFGDSTSFYATKTIEKAVGLGEYDVIESKTTDNIIRDAKKQKLDPTGKLVSAGADILIQSSIDMADCYDDVKEDWYTDKNGKRHVEVWVEREARLSLNVVVWDLKTQNIIDSFTFRGKKTEESTYGESREDCRIPSAERMYEKILDDIKIDIRNRLVPHYEKINLNLLPNKPKNEELAIAWDKVEDGDLNQALSLFEKDWELNSTTVSGYNSAVLQYALGKPEDAIELAKDVFEVSGNEKAKQLADSLNAMLENQNYAKLQINGDLRASSGSKIQY